MAKESLRRMGRFELLQLIYQMKKSNEELTLRCRDLEKQLDNLKRDSAQRQDKLKREYEQRIDEIRMQGAAKDLQERMKKIEQQLIAFQRLTDRDPAENAAMPGSSAAPFDSSAALAGFPAPMLGLTDALPDLPAAMTENWRPASAAEKQTPSEDGA